MWKLRLTLVIAILMAAVVVGGYRLSQPEPEMVSAAPVPPPARVKVADISVQAMSVEEVEARTLPRIADQTNIYRDQNWNFHLRYPAGWERLTLSDSLTLFQSPDGESRIRVEAAGPVPLDGLSGFVDRSLGQAMVYSRQQLTVYGAPAERVVTVDGGSMETSFYINWNGTIFVVSGVGQQQAIELAARSFNAPLQVALR